MKLIKLLVFLFALCLANSASAQNYPTKLITLVVPYAVGGGSDFVARLLGLILTEVLEQSVIIENHTGAGGLIGVELVARAPVNSHTLLLADASLTISPVVNKKSTYSATQDFEPIALVAYTPYVFITPATASADSLLDDVAQARSQPNKLSIGSAGSDSDSGSGSHFAGELFQLKTHLKLIHIPYKRSGQVTVDTMSGQVNSSFATAPSVVQNYKSDKLKILAAASHQRSAALPDVPVFSELGFKNVVITNWYGVLALGGTSTQIVERLSQELARIMQLTDVRERLNSAALKPMNSTPQSFSEHIASELSKWEYVAREAKIQLD